MAKYKYDTKYQCRYHNDDIFLPTDEVNEQQKEYIRNILYREDLQNIFGLNDEEEFELFDKILPELYVNLKDSPFLRKCMNTVASSNLFCENEELGLCILFSYDYLYLAHKCISSYLENTTILEKDIEQLELKIKS
jgi:hypothetical protein